MACVYSVITNNQCLYGSIANNVSILTEGSVKTNNALSSSKPDVDGGLIKGGAALVADDFIAYN